MERFVCWGGDMRMKLLSEQLEKKNCFCQWFSGMEIPSWENTSWCILPIPTLDKHGFLQGSEGKVTQEDVLTQLPPGISIAAYLPEKTAEAWRQRRPDIKLNLFNEDEVFLRDNGRISAEGALMLAGARGKCLSSSCCMVMGYGYMGSALCSMLRGIGARVIVAGRRGGTLERAEADGFICVDNGRWDKIIHQVDWIMNTIPHKLLDKNVLQKAKKDCCLMEFASAPYGLEKEDAAELGLVLQREPGIPGRLYPYSAAEAMLDSVLRIVKKKARENDA